MTWLSALAIYFIVWWLTLFCVLPWRADSAYEAGDEVEKGHAPSAPHKPRMVQKFAVTTVISAMIFGTAYLLVSNGIVTVDNIPFLPTFGNY